MSLHVPPHVAFNMLSASQLSSACSLLIARPSQPTFTWTSANNALAKLRRDRSLGLEEVISSAMQLLDLSGQADAKLKEYRRGSCKLSEVRHLIKRMVIMSSTYGASCKGYMMSCSMIEDAHQLEAIRVIGLHEIIATSWYG